MTRANSVRARRILSRLDDLVEDATFDKDGQAMVAAVGRFHSEAGNFELSTLQYCDTLDESYVALRLRYVATYALIAVQLAETR